MPNGKNRATRFSIELMEKLNDLSKRGLLADYEWEKNGHPHGLSRECVDVVGKRPDGTGLIIFVEAELRRGNPESNVAKIWKWLEKRGDGSPVLLIQGFSRYYDKSSPQVHMETAIFFGQQMCKSRNDIRYIPVSIDYMPGPGTTVLGAGRRTQHAHELAETVASRARFEIAKQKRPAKSGRR